MFVLFSNIKGVTHAKNRFAVVAKDTDSTDRQINRHDLFETFLSISNEGSIFFMFALSIYLKVCFKANG